MSLVDFTPETYSPGRNENRLNLIYLFLFAIVMSSLVLAAWVGRSGYKRIERISQEVDSEYRQAGKQVDAIQSQQSDLFKLVLNANIAAKLIQPMPRYQVLSELNSCMPDGVIFSSIKLKTAKPKASAATAAAAAKKQFKGKTAATAAKTASKDSRDEIPLILQADIVIDGKAGNNEQIAGFLCNVKAVEVFRDVELVYSQSDPTQPETPYFFQMRLTLDTSVIKQRNKNNLNAKLAYSTSGVEGVK